MIYVYAMYCYTMSMIYVVTSIRYYRSMTYLKHNYTHSDPASAQQGRKGRLGQKRRDFPHVFNAAHSLVVMWAQLLVRGLTQL